MAPVQGAHRHPGQRPLKVDQPGETRVAGQASPLAGVDLLDDDAYLVKAVGEVEQRLWHSATCPLFVALNHFAPGEIARKVGEIELPIEISADIMPGVVCMPHGYGHAREGVELEVARQYAGVSINDLTDEFVLDELTGNAAFSGVRVRVRIAN